MLVHDFKPSAWKAEAGGISVNLRKVWSVYQAPVQSGLQRETMSQKERKEERKGGKRKKEKKH